MKPLFEVVFKHWWYWFIPSRRKQKRILQAYINAHETELKARLEEQYRNLMIYGCSISPEELYGKGDIDVGPTNN